MASGFALFLFGAHVCIDHDAAVGMAFVAVALLVLVVAVAAR